MSNEQFYFLRGVLLLPTVGGWEVAWQFGQGTCRITIVGTNVCGRRGVCRIGSVVSLIYLNVIIVDYR